MCNAGDLGSIPGLGRSPGEGKGCPLQYSSSVMLVIKALCYEWDCLEKVNPCLLRHTLLEFNLYNTEKEEDEVCLWPGPPVEIS